MPNIFIGKGTGGEKREEGREGGRKGGRKGKEKKRSPRCLREGHPEAKVSLSRVRVFQVEAKSEKLTWF